MIEAIDLWAQNNNFQYLVLNKTFEEITSFYEPIKILPYLAQLNVLYNKKSLPTKMPVIADRNKGCPCHGPHNTIRRTGHCPSCEPKWKGHWTNRFPIAFQLLWIAFQSLWVALNHYENRIGSHWIALLWISNVLNTYRYSQCS